MPSYEEFLATIGATGEFAPFDEGRLPLNIPGMLPATQPPRQFQKEVADEIMRQLDEHFQYIRKNFPDDEWLPVRILARAEKLFTSYVDEQFDRLVPLRDEIRKILHTRWRMERRRFIRILLMRPHLTLNREFLNENRFGKPEDVAEDFEAAERCVNEGTWLLEGLGLQRRSKSRVS
jgi:hypothetical protein